MLFRFEGKGHKKLFELTKKGTKTLTGTLYVDANEIVGKYLGWLQTQDLVSSKRMARFAHDISLEVEVLRHSTCKFLGISSELGCLDYKDVSDAFIEELNKSFVLSEDYKTNEGASMLVQSCVMFMSYLRAEVEGED